MTERIDKFGLQVARPLYEMIENEALPGTRYCGLPAHQALAGSEPEVRHEVPASAEAATPEEAEELEPVATVDVEAEQPAEATVPATDSEDERDSA